MNATVLDARDESTRGIANDPSGFALKKSSDAFEVILRADGYVDLTKTIIPEGDREYDLELEKVRKKTARRKSTKKTTTSKTDGDTKKAEATPPPKKKPARKKDYGIRDLKDPFE